MQLARIVGIALLLILTACASGLSKEDYIKQADQICAEADSKTEELAVPRTPEDLSVFVEEAQQITGQLLDDLRALEPPEDDRETIDRMLAKIEEAMSYLPQIQEAAEVRDLDKITSIGESLQASASEANQIAQEYGLEKCGRAQPAAVP